MFPSQQIKSRTFIYVSSGDQCFLGIAYKELSNTFDCHPEALGLLHDLLFSREILLQDGLEDLPVVGKTGLP